LAYEKAEEILLRCEAEVARPDLLSLVQIHHAQVWLYFAVHFVFSCCVKLLSLVQIHHAQVCVYLFIISIRYVILIVECVYCSVFCLKLVAIIAWRRNLKGKSLRTFCLN
jgi:hypothetical protein